MNRIILYLDCDGVILNTIEEAKKMAAEMHIDYTDPVVFNYFFRIVDWNVLIYRAGVLDNAIIKIKRIIESGKYDVKILTKLSGNEYEELIKRRLFAKLLPGVEVITLDIRSHKDEVVDPKGNILIEDSVGNAKRWNASGGVGILLKLDTLDLENDIIDDIAKFEETKGVQKLLKKA